MFNLSFKNYLLQNSGVEESKIEDAYQATLKNGSLLQDELVRLKYLEEREVYQHFAKYLGIPYKLVQLTELDFDLIQKFPLEKMIEYKALPIEEDDNHVLFAICNPFRIEELNEFASNTGKKIDYCILEPSQMNLLVRYTDNKIQQAAALSDFATTSTGGDADTSIDGQILIDAPVIKLCDSILKDAVNRGASDIHIEPFEKEILLRFRIDGKLVIVDRMTPTYYQSMLARYKIMAEMNIAERRVPQDGAIKLEIGNSKYDFRVSTLPTLFGEKLVIRIYDIGLSTSSLENLGMNKRQEELVLNMIHRPHGILLLTGPTGSGKSTSLYTFLRYLNKPDTNIITVEDPVENQIDGINQVQVNPKANLTFANTLRSILRQDPNIIMIGEIRDEETAQIATRAAITGHLVLSTIHANDSYSVVARLINMGIAPYLVADSLLGSISQRLVRKLCPICKKPHLSTPEEMATLGLKEAHTIYEPCGCQACNGTGYSGRIGVFEILVNNHEIRNTIMDDKFTSELLEEVAHIPSLLDNAKQRVLNGETSISEYQELSNVIDTSKGEQ